MTCKMTLKAWSPPWDICSKYIIILQHDQYNYFNFQILSELYKNYVLRPIDEYFYVASKHVPNVCALIWLQMFLEISLELLN